VERFYTRIDIVNPKNNREIAYAGFPVVEREMISDEEYAQMHEAAMADLNNLIGLKPVKGRLEDLLKAAKNPMAHKGQKPCPGHYVFVGNPGTGKTTVARLVGKILRSEGLLKKGHIVEVKKADLVADHIGGTQAKSLAKFEEALDGVLFFDEAYELVNTSSTAQDVFESPFDKEAYTLLLKFMEDNRERVCVICAGYEDKMEVFLDANEGMRERFTETIKFPDYSASELYEILLFELKNKTSLHISEGYLNEAKKALTSMSEDAKSGLVAFSNARSVRRFVEDSILSATRRDPNTTELLPQDIPQRYKPFDFNSEENKKLRDEAWAKLDELVGLGEIKEKLTDLINVNSRAAGTSKEPGHYAFVGNPGTGKTETARLVADILYSSGLLRTNKLIKVRAADIVGKYVGHSAPLAIKKCEEAIDGVLFVDEAYTLVSADALNGPFASTFAKETYEAIMDFMEDYRKRLCVIFAGYENEMNVFLDANSGMRSRISPDNVIKFRDFSDDELIQILRMMAKNRSDFHFVLTDEFLDEVRKLLPGIRREKNFGNARTMRGFLKECIPAYINRVPISERIVLSDGVEQITLPKSDLPKRFLHEQSPDQIPQGEDLKPIFHLIPRNAITDSADPYAGIDIHGKDFPEFCSRSIPRIDNEFGSASAFVISPDGYAITCAHVVAFKKDLGKMAKNKLIARFRNSDGSEKSFPFEIINTRPDLDMALIQIKSDQALPYLALAPEEREIKYGEDCLLCGYPDGRDGILLSKGSISSFAEKCGDGELGNIYFYNGAAFPGDSGGPIIAKDDGCVIGILRGARGPQDGTKHNYMKPICYFWKEFLE
jgi:AAA+ superfamily predicted ATPase